MYTKLWRRCGYQKFIRSHICFQLFKNHNKIDHVSEFLANYNMPNFCSVILYDVKICEQVFVHNEKDSKMWKWDRFKASKLKLYFSCKDLSLIKHCSDSLKWKNSTMFCIKKICIIWTKIYYFWNHLVQFNWASKLAFSRWWDTIIFHFTKFER